MVIQLTEEVEPTTSVSPMSLNGATTTQTGTHTQRYMVWTTRLERGSSVRKMQRRSLVMKLFV